MKHSNLDQHLNNNRELVPPFLSGELGKMLELHSWSQERLPEYLWIGLLRESVSRETFFKKMWYLKEYILSNYEENIGKFSTILSLSSENKMKLFNKIKELFGSNILDPLIVVSHFDTELRKAFYSLNSTNNSRIKKIEDIVKKMYDRYSEISMDVRYIIIILNSNKLYFMNGQSIVTVLTEYPNTSFDNPIMEMYKVEISAFEGIEFVNDFEYANYFYEEMYLMSDCKPLILDLGKNAKKAELKKKLLEIRGLLIKSEEIKYNHKKDVIMGNLSDRKSVV